ncbi:branched-chain amino acid transport system substrate-binding protein [Parafrankia irregularis]|uniref:Branched-chain amino acid transport system substrate-binding protein n=1 Tax=Parafrankia irregularis TaxID=795642 RepID=A0A0S4QMP3_9ACTN|nr:MULTISPECIES: ABC transporter substrate-binding protein [Parafrankia]MBE3200606.1 ABC transporter substrate-binding protein [Parafrankia sp. CH37]CUU56939.1 branched-chain amino acid transport system substrate-binding protein [Parafrankia irregularis]
MQHTVAPGGRPTQRGARRRLVRAGLAAPLAALLFVAACGSDEETTPSPADASAAAGALGPVDKAAGEPVKIGIVSDGKSAGIDNSVQFAVADATAKYLNEHRGGIGGRPVEVVTCETQADPAKGTDCGNQLVEKNVVAVAVGESAVAEAVWKPLSDADIPTMFFGAGSPSILSDPTSFTVGDPNFAVLNLPISLAKDEGIKKVTTVVIDVPAALHSAEEVAPGLMKKAGLEYQLIRIAPGTADMTPQMQSVVSNESGLVFIIGNDSFCISAINGLRSVGYDGKVSAISQCITDATRKAVPGDALEGMTIGASVPVGGDDPSSLLYNSVVDTYGKDIEPDSSAGRGMFVTFAGLAASLEDITGEITPATVTAAIKAMPEKELPGAGGLKFQCGGKAYPETPAACVKGGLTTELDGKGEPTAYTVRGNS